MEVAGVAVILSVGPLDPVHPGLHTGHAVSEDVDVPAEFIQRPGNNGRRVAPDAGAGCRHVKSRHDVRHIALPHLLLRVHVKKELVVEGIGIRIEAGRRNKDLRIRRPAHALIALRAVGRHIDEIALLPPENIGDQLIDLRKPGRERAGRREIRIAGKAGEIIDGQMRGAVHLRVTVAIEGEKRLEDMLLSVRGVPVLREGSAQVVAVEIPLLQNFAHLDMNLRPRRFMDPQSENACLVLAEVIDLLAGRRVNQCDRPDFFMNLHRNRQALFQRELLFQFCCRPEYNCRHRLRLRQRVVPDFAVVNIGESNLAAGDLPAVVGSDYLTGAVFIADHQLRNQLPGIAVERSALRIGSKTEPSFIPAGAEHDRQLALFAAFRILPQQVSHIISLILNPFFVVIAVRRQDFVSDTLSVNPCRIETETADIESGCRHLFPVPHALRRERFVKDRVPLIAVVTADPLSLPRLIHQSRFKEVQLALRFLPRIAPHFHRPVIAGAGL